MTMIYPPEDEIVAYYLKMMVDHKRNNWPSNLLKSEDVYCTNPWTHFNTTKPMNDWPINFLHDGRYLFVNKSEESGKTDGCESGCWRVVGRDKLIKSKTGKFLGFKKIYKFCEKEEPISIFRCWEREKRRVKDKRVWVMEETRLARKWEQDYVICKIRLLNPNPLELLLCNHIRGNHMLI